MSESGAGSRHSPQRRPSVLVTRPWPDAQRFAEELLRAGFTPLFSPVLEIAVMPTPVSFAGVGALAFTSANGVRSLIASIGAVPALPAFAVGPATAEAARAAGFRCVYEASGDAADLVRVVAEAAGKGEIEGLVLHVAGADIAADISASLEALGVASSTIVVYAARPVLDLSSSARAAFVAGAPPDWIALFSPRSARLLLRQMERSGFMYCLRACRAACLSQAVAGALRGSRWRSVEVAARPNTLEMTRLIASFAAPPQA